MIYVNFEINDSNPFELKSAKVYITQGLTYAEYCASVAKFRTGMQEVFNSSGHTNNQIVVVTIISNFKYDELIVDAFLSIQSNVEDDSFLKHLDYSYMDMEDILKYVEKYHMYI